jgi:hypothetical protein
LRPKTLTRHEELEIERAFHEEYRKHKKDKSLPQLWYATIMTWLSWKFEGSEIITRKVRDAEIKIMQNETHSTEYTAALMQIVLPPDSTLSEQQKLILLMTAGNDEREQAILLIQS